MTDKPLHITNGNSLTDYLNTLDVKGEKLTWQEMLCEGPTHEIVDSDEFLNIRKAFFDAFYNIELDIQKIKKEIKKLEDFENYSEIILWFEYDLFCHINMVAVISLIQQKQIKAPIYLVCSGRTNSGKTLKGLTELNANELMLHYKNKVLLNEEDITMATTIWSIYCGLDHNLLKPYIVKRSSFDYLSNCLKAHLKRFPDSVDGLNIIEKNILQIINKYKITSKNHLLGYAINYQGFYGYGDLQLSRIIDQLNLFYAVGIDKLELNRAGHIALLGHHNYALEIDNSMRYGGVKKIDFQFNISENKLIKSVFNAN